MSEEYGSVRTSLGRLGGTPVSRGEPSHSRPDVVSHGGGDEDTTDEAPSSEQFALLQGQCYGLLALYAASAGSPSSPGMLQALSGGAPPHPHHTPPARTKPTNVLVVEVDLPRHDGATPAGRRRQPTNINTSTLSSPPSDAHARVVDRFQQRTPTPHQHHNTASTSHHHTPMRAFMSPLRVVLDTALREQLEREHDGTTDPQYEDDREHEDFVVVDDDASDEVDEYTPARGGDASGSSQEEEEGTQVVIRGAQPSNNSYLRQEPTPERDADGGMWERHNQRIGALHKVEEARKREKRLLELRKQAQERAKRSARKTKRPESAARCILRWFNQMKEAKADHALRELGSRRVDAVRRHEGAVTIQRQWAAYSSRKAFRENQHQLLREYLENELFLDESASTIQNWWRHLFGVAIRKGRSQAAHRDYINSPSYRQLLCLSEDRSSMQERTYAVRLISRAIFLRVVAKQEVVDALVDKKVAHTQFTSASFLPRDTTPIPTGSSISDANLHLDALAMLQEHHRAATMIQCAHRSRSSRKRVATCIQNSIDKQRELREQEAARTIRHFSLLVKGKADARQKAKENNEAKQQAFIDEKATSIQAALRGFEARLKVKRSIATRDVAVLKVQSCIRQFIARKRMYWAKEAALDVLADKRINELVLGVQAASRGFLLRTSHRRQQRRLALAAIMPRVLLGYRARRGMRMAQAVRTIQRFANLHRDRTRFLKYRALCAAPQRKQRCVDHAARLIQRAWKKHLFRRFMDEKVMVAVRENRAARIIQHGAKVFICRAALSMARLVKHRNIEWMRINQAAVIITAAMRGYEQRCRYMRIKEIIRHCAGLIARCASGYVTRRWLSSGEEAFKQHKAALTIQRGLTAMMAKKKDNEVLQKRREAMRIIHRREEAAVVLQRNLKMHVQRTAFRKEHAIKCTAAHTIGAFVRAVESRTHYLEHLNAYRRRRAAFTIQRLWAKNRRRFLQNRAIRDLSERLVDMGFTSISKSERALRAGIVDLHAARVDEMLSEMFYEGIALQERLDERDRLWMLRCPLPLQDQAALDCQRMFRGYLARKRASASGQSTLSSSKTTQMGHTAAGLRRISDMVQSLRHAEAVENLVRRKRRVADTTPTCLPPIAFTESPTYDDVWLPWLHTSNPDLLLMEGGNVERLLQRECRGRARITKEFDMIRAEAVGHLHRRISIATGSVKGVTHALKELRSSGLPAEEAAAARGVVLPPLVMRRPPTSDSTAVPAAASSSAATPRRLPLLITNKSPSQLDKPSPAKVRLEGILQQLGDEFSDAAVNNALVVDLTNLNLNDAEVRVVLERVKHCDYVSSLYLGGNSIRDATCADIADVLSHSRSLRRVSIANTPISDVGASHLALAVSTSPSMEVLDLDGTLITEYYRSHIRQILAHRAQIRRRVRDDGAREEEVRAHNIAHPPAPVSCLPSKRQAEISLQQEDEGEKRLKHLLSLAAQRRSQQQHRSGKDTASHIYRPRSPIQRAPTPQSLLSDEL